MKYLLLLVNLIEDSECGDGRDLSNGSRTFSDWESILPKWVGRMKRIVILVSLLLLLLTATARAEYKSKIAYHEWDANSWSFGLAYVMSNSSQIGVELSSATLIDGTSRKDNERWFVTYSLNRDIKWRLGAVFSRSMDLSADGDAWKRDDSKTSVQPLVGVSLERPIADRLLVRLQADVFRSHSSNEIVQRVVAEAMYRGLIVGYTSDSDSKFTGPHIAYEFHVF